jgi:hypothetical protein
MKAQEWAQVINESDGKPDTMWSCLTRVLADLTLVEHERNRLRASKGIIMAQREAFLVGVTYAWGGHQDHDLRDSALATAEIEAIKMYPDGE